MLANVRVIKITAPARELNKPPPRHTKILFKKSVIPTYAKDADAIFFRFLEILPVATWRVLIQNLLEHMDLPAVTAEKLSDLLGKFPPTVSLQQIDDRDQSLLQTDTADIFLPSD